MSNPADLLVGKPAQAVAAVTDSAGNNVVPASLLWATSDTSVLTVDATGLITLVAAGKATVTATATDATGNTGIGKCDCTVTGIVPGALTVTVDVTQPA